MLSDRESVPAPPWAYAACVALVMAGFLAFGLNLNRYPLPYVDEAFFNYPAYRWIQGFGLTWPVSAAAPYADRLWAYHGPLYPWLQVVVFQVFGVSPMACRMPQFLAAHLAIALLAVSLLRRRLWMTAIGICPHLANPLIPGCGCGTF